MSENVAPTVQKVIQDLVAPDLRKLKTVIASNQKQTDNQFVGMQKQIDQRFDAQDQINNAQFKAIMSAIAGVKAQSDLNTVQAISALSERVAILEFRHQ